MRSAPTIDRSPPVRMRSDRLRWHGSVARIETSHAGALHRGEATTMTGTTTSNTSGVATTDRASDEVTAVVTIVPESANGPLSAEFVARAVARAHRLAGPNARIVTPALTNEESVGFLAAGFVATSRLHLLVHHLDDAARPRDVQRLHRDAPVATFTAARLRRGRSSDVAAALVVDGRAFEPPWCLDPAGLDAARRATPIARFRVVELDGQVVGFCVTGRSGRRGYLQRLAVDPKWQGGGLGFLLVNDALGWCRRRRVLRVVVNTQVGNVRALSLYRTLGFCDTAVGLCILERQAVVAGANGGVAEWGS